MNQHKQNKNKPQVNQIIELPLPIFIYHLTHQKGARSISQKV